MDPIDTANVDEVVALGAALYAAYKSDGANLNAIQKKSIEKIKVGESTGKFYGTISLSDDNLPNAIIVAISIAIGAASDKIDAD